MALVTSGSLTAAYQEYFSKELLQRQLPILQMEQFGMKAALPRKNGNKQIRFFRYDNPSISSILEVTSEGTSPGTGAERQLTLSTVGATLQQFASLVKLTDILQATNLFDSMAQATTQLAEDHALHADTLVHRVLTTGTTSGTGTLSTSVRYAQNSNSTAFIAATAANSAFTALDLLDSVTALRVDKAPTIKGGYILVADPRTARSILNDDDYIQAHRYSNVDSLLKGEVGTYYGVKTLLSHNILSFGSASANAISGTAAAAYNSSTAPFLANVVLGDQAFGVPSLTGDSPYSPKVLIAEGPDKSDPLDLVTSVAVKTYYTSVVLNPAFYRIVFSRSEVS